MTHLILQYAHIDPCGTLDPMLSCPTSNFTDLLYDPPSLPPSSDPDNQTLISSPPTTTSIITTIQKPLISPTRNLTAEKLRQWLEEKERSRVEAAVPASGGRPLKHKQSTFAVDQPVGTSPKAGPVAVKNSNLKPSSQFHGPSSGICDNAWSPFASCNCKCG